MLLFDLPRGLHPLLWRHRLPPLSEPIVHELSNVAASQRDLLDARVDHEAVGDGYDVCEAITGIHDDAGEIRARSAPVPLFDLDLIHPLCVQGEHCLNRNVEAPHIKCFEHDLGRELPILRCVEGRLGKQEVVLLRRATEVPEDRVLHETLDVVPVLDAAPDHRVRKQVPMLFPLVSFLTNVEVRVGHAKALALAHVHGVRKPGRVGDGRRGDEQWLNIARIAHLRVAGTDVHDDCWPPRH
mmetsp:Transcript_93981/g.270780  ORF Transcript_93981/g.270780 Transcript_93981/m.270780 type:complete len:241 (+) Transcript_93981:445-1167(+)